MEIKIAPLALTIVSGTSTFPAGQTVYVGPTPPPPNICPGCGRCKDCGQPFAAPPTPLPPYVWPGLPGWGSGEVTFTGSVVS